jgi:hypothetical protein
MLRLRLLLRERVYRATAQKRPWYIRPSHGRWIATALRATILYCVPYLPVIRNLYQFTCNKYESLNWVF